MLDASTYVLRSMAGGTTRVSMRLNPRRAMTLCWRANSDSSARSIASAEVHGPSAAESSDLGTPKSPTKPMAYRKVARKIT
jgi:hypothetical protein